MFIIWIVVFSGFIQCVLYLRKVVWSEVFVESEWSQFLGVLDGEFNLGYVVLFSFDFYYFDLFCCF